MIAVRSLAAATLLGALGCGPTTSTPQPVNVTSVGGNATPTDRGPIESDAFCTYSGEMFVPLHAPRSGRHYATVHAVGATRLLAAGSDVRLETWVEQSGWALSGSVSASEVKVMRLRRDLALSDTVTLLAGMQVRVVDLDAGVHVDFESELESAHIHLEPSALPVPLAVPDVTPGQTAPTRSVDRARIGAARLRLACEDFGFARVLPTHSAGEYAAEVVGSEPLEYAAQPGGPVSTRVDSQAEATVLERGPEFTRVEHRAGRFRVRGWVPTSRLRTQSLGGLMGGVFGSIGQPPSPVACRVNGPQRLLAITGDGVEHVGDLAQGAAFYPGGQDARGQTVARTPFLAPAPGVTLVAEGDSTCAPVPSDSRFFHQGPGLRAVSVLDRAEGLAGVDAGDTCVIDIVDTSGGCRAVVRCGEHTVFGDLRTNGFVPGCTYSSDPPSARGVDADVSGVRDGDPTFAIDTAAGTFASRDEAAGRFGAFDVRGNIASIEHRADLALP